MAGAVAFVFGLCALSFAAGCVVTAVMLRHPDPAEEAPPPLAPPESVPVPTLRLSLPSDDLAARPIHRNPVVGRPAPAALDHGDAAPDPTFAGVFDPPPAPLPVVEAPVVERSFAALPNNGRASWARADPWTGRTLYAEQELLLEAACAPVARDEVEPPVLRAVAAEPEHGAEEVSTPGEVPVDDAIAGPSVPAARTGQRDEVELELAARPELSPAPAVVDTGSGPEVATAETVFASRSGLVTDPAPDPAAPRPEPAKPESDAVVPEQGVPAEPVVPKQHVVPNDEFRKRYLRTFEAARRRSNH